MVTSENEITYLKQIFENIYDNLISPAKENALYRDNSIYAVRMYISIKISFQSNNSPTYVLLKTFIFILF